MSSGGSAERRLAAILSADAVGYSRLMSADDEGTVRTLTGHREAISAVVREHRGRVVDSPGDNLLAELPSALDATRCAVEVQRVLAARNADLPADGRLAFRIGVHMGDVMAEGERIYGDGVNVAARLEALAEPGGICISGTVHEQVRNRMETPFEDLGEREVKNIPQPVRVFRLGGGQRGADVGASGPPAPRWKAALALAVPALLIVVGVLVGRMYIGEARIGPPAATVDDAPSIAVLPFDNMSGDAEQEYFSDGIAEDLITDLSKISGLIVIARNSSFTYKGRAVRVDQVGRELGVRYVLEGSVRRAGDRVRITAQLIEAESGQHLWADRYDRELRDVFAVQDEVTREIVAQLRVKLSDRELARVERRPTADLVAYDLYLRGNAKLARADFNAARRLFERALERDPNFAEAWSMAGFIDLAFLLLQSDPDPQRLDRAEADIRRALAIAPELGRPHAALAMLLAVQGEHEQALAEARLGVELGPGDPFTHTQEAAALGFGGRPREAIRAAETGIRLDPVSPLSAPARVHLASAYLQLGESDRALDTIERALELSPEFFPLYLLLAIVEVERAELEAAREAARRLLQFSPGYTTGGMRPLFRDPALNARYATALRKAGVP